MKPGAEAALAAEKAGSGRSPALLIGVALYAGLLVAAHRSGLAWPAALAVVVLVAAAQSAALRHGQPRAWLILVGVAVAAMAAVHVGQPYLLADLIPVAITGGLAFLFARSLQRGRVPLIARAIMVIESPARLQQPQVAGYARGLTLAWALVLGVQAIVLLALVLRAADGPLAALGLAPPWIAAGALPRWQIQVAGYGLVLALMLLEYPFRRFYLRRLVHMPAREFVTRITRRWPALLVAVMAETPSLIDDPRAR